MRLRARDLDIISIILEDLIIPIKLTSYPKILSSRDGCVSLRFLAYSSWRERDPEQSDLRLLPCSLLELMAEVLPILLFHILFDAPFLELVPVLVLAIGELVQSATR